MPFGKADYPYEEVDPDTGIPIIVGDFEIEYTMSGPKGEPSITVDDVFALDYSGNRVSLWKAKTPFAQLMANHITRTASEDRDFINDLAREDEYDPSECERAANWEIAREEAA